MIDLNNLNETFIIAEIGINHNGSLENLLKMMEVAKDSGADAVKLQVMTGFDLVSKELDFTYENKGKSITTKLANVFHDNRVKFEWLPTIYKRAKELELICMATPFSYETVDELEKVDNPIYKVSSGDITHTPLIEYIAKTGKPIIISTGKSTLGDIDRALQAVGKTGNKNVAILHCVSVYPTPFDELNLNLIESLKETFDVTVGFSDHSEGYFSSSIAVAKGAKIVEKHFTLDKNLPGPDHWFSLNPEELKELVSHIRLTEKMFGSKLKTIYKNEERVSVRASRSIVLSKDLAEGSELTEENITYLRPGTGAFMPYDRQLILGKKLSKALKEGHLLQFEDIEW